MPRPHWLPLLFLASTLAACTTPPAHAPNPPRFSVVEATIPDMQKAMTEGRISSRGLVEQYLARIALYEDKLNAVITVNPKVLEEADRLDQEHKQGKIRGPLHGIPIALKDNILTTDIRTTGGAIAFENLMPPYDATLTKNLRDAGAVIIAKTVMTELANYIAAGMPGNYSAVGGYGLNPYDPRLDPRPANADGRPALGTGGSSSGIGTAANFWAANVGTETSGSILSPSNQNMLAGIKPTVGRISRYGVIPITADQDTAGPDGEDGDRRRDPVRRARKRRARSERPGDEGVPAAAQPRLHGRFSSARVSRARASAFRARTITTGSRRPATRSRAAASARRRPSRWPMPSRC